MTTKRSGGGPRTVSLSHELAASHLVAGGKGAHLALLTSGGFQVPPAFIVTSESYTEFIRHSGLDTAAVELVANLDYQDLPALEAETAKFRQRVLDAPVPADLANELATAYTAFGDEPYVAVRSSGTAEDLADASFAGMHDTYLNIRGVEGVVEAVKKCWSSLWTARAVSYRNARGFDHLSAQLPVVVQVMVEADASGVAFAANPLTADTSEIVINASWGLGESVVSGAVTPDEFIVDYASLRVKQRTLGSKSSEIVLDSAAGAGTVTRPVPEERRAKFALTDVQLNAIGRLVRNITEHFDGRPQDIEWAVVGDELYVLQSRDITGAEFTWDEDVDAWHPVPDDPNTVWTLQFANEFWNGPLTPLHYSVRTWEFRKAHLALRSNHGFDEMFDMRMFKYSRARAYYNTKVEAMHVERIAPSSLRPAMLGNVHPEDRPAVINAPFDKRRLASMVVRQLLDSRSRPDLWLKKAYANMEDSRGLNQGLPAEELRKLSDEELKDYINDRVNRWENYNTHVWYGWFSWGTWAVQAVAVLLQKWLPEMKTEDFLETVQALLSGLPLPATEEAKERQALWELGVIIRESLALSKLFWAHEDGAFFAECEETEEGREFLTHYTKFLERYGHRGSADRDWSYPRRVEDPALDYRSLRAIVGADHDIAPFDMEQRSREKREAVTEQVLAQLRKKPLGWLKEQTFVFTLDWAHKLLKLRDDQRHHNDIIVMGKKRGFQELGLRLYERGVLDRPDDFYFLSWKELYEVFDGRADRRMALVKAKIAGRRSMFEQVDRREIAHPMYLKDGRPYGDNSVADDSVSADGVMQGVGTSVGTVTARARVVPGLKELGRLQKGEILVCNATDPGWAAAFLTIKGLVIEEGGLLAHGACLSREYGIPAVTLAHAMRRIPDGALITIDGSTGQVQIVPEEEGSAADGQALPAGSGA